MFENVGDLKIFLIGLRKDNVVFSPHFYEKMGDDRNYLSEDLVFGSLKDVGNLLGFQSQKIGDEERFRIGVKISNKYNLVVVCKVSGESLYIITAWKSNRKWEKMMRK